MTLLVSGETDRADQRVPARQSAPLPAGAVNSGATSDRVYDAVKRRLLSGDILPGERLDPNRFADEFHSSKTPVRDALHRLSGERLVDARPGEGFRLPMVTEPGLRDLYIWNASLLRMLVALWPRDAAGRERTDLPVDLARAPSALFAVFAARTGNDEFIRQLDAANDRLATARVAETLVLDGLEAEARAFAVALDRAPRGTILQAIASYHRRRLRAVAELVRAMYRRGENRPPLNIRDISAV